MYEKHRNKLANQTDKKADPREEHNLFKKLFGDIQQAIKV